jgi:hypothetical protein
MVSEASRPLGGPGNETTSSNSEQDTVMEDSRSSNAQNTTTDMVSALDEIEPSSRVLSLVQHRRKSVLAIKITRPVTKKSPKVHNELRRRRYKSRRKG